MALALVSFGFLFDSLALGLAQANPLLLQAASTGPMSSYVATMMHSMSFPVLILIYVGSIGDIMLAGSVSSYLRGRGRKSLGPERPGKSVS